MKNVQHVTKVTTAVIGSKVCGYKQPSYLAETFV